MDEKNEYNKRIYTTRERERERACGQQKKTKKKKKKCVTDGRIIL